MTIEPTSSPEIENLLAESRTFPPDPAFTAQANATADLYDEAERDFEAFWARLARERIDWVKPFDEDPRVGPAVRQVVRRRQAQRRLQLRRPPRRARPRRQGRLPLDRRAGRHADASPTPTCSARSRKAANALLELGVDDGRPRRDLHADDPGAADRDARLRAHRRAAHRRLRRLLAPRRSPAASTTRRPSSSSPPTAAGGAARPCRSRPTVDEALATDARRSSTCSSSSARRRGEDGRR